MADHEIVARGSRDLLGEGPRWLPGRDSLLWVDIVGRKINRLTLSDGRIDTYDTPERIGWIIDRAGRDDFIIGLKSGFAFLDLDTGAITRIGNPEADRPGNRLNDAKTDLEGRIWCGSKDDSDELASGAFYRLDADLSWRRADDGYLVTNGPTFSPDGRTLYHTDSGARIIYAFDLTADGEAINRRVWLTFPEEWGHPDGMTTDSEGCVWVAHWGGGCISRFSPEGERLSHIDLPAAHITSCVFAGERLDRMFVTSASIEQADAPHAGALFEVFPGVTGLSQAPFAG